MYRILLLLSAAITMSSCSLDGSGSFYDPAMMAPSASSSSYYNGCEANSCAPAGQYSAGHAQQTYSGYGHAPAHQASTFGGQRPDAHAYGSQVQGGYHAQGYHVAQGAPQLRGPHKIKRQGYKYGTLGAVMYDTDSDLYGIQGRLGYQTAGVFGGEVEGSFGVKGETGTVGTTPAEFNVDYQVGAFATARAPIGERFSVLGRFGYAATKSTLEIGTSSGSETFDGIAYGAAAEYAFDPRNSIRADYTRYESNDLLGTSDSLAVSYARKF